MTREELVKKTIEELREIGKSLNVKGKNKSVLIDRILQTYVSPDLSEEFEDLTSIFLENKEKGRERAIKVILAHISNEHYLPKKKWIKLKYNSLNRLNAVTERYIELADQADKVHGRVI